MKKEINPEIHEHVKEVISKMFGSDGYKKHKYVITLGKKYGMSESAYEVMLKEQKNNCAICSKHSASGKKLGVDHNHRTGKVRGLLCAPCNFGIGQFKEDIEILKSAIAYLEKHTSPEQFVLL